MSGKFKGKYRIESARMRNWDYGWHAAYFVTICTKNRYCFFGNIVNDKMILSPIGEIVKSEWLKTPSIRPDMNLTLDEFVVMPNHFHAIIIIGKNEYNKPVNKNGYIGRRDGMHDCTGRRRHACRLYIRSIHIRSIHIRGTFKRSTITQKQIRAATKKFIIHYSWVQIIRNHWCP